MFVSFCCIFPYRHSDVRIVRNKNFVPIELQLYNRQAYRFAQVKYALQISQVFFDFLNAYINECDVLIISNLTGRELFRPRLDGELFIIMKTTFLVNETPLVKAKKVEPVRVDTLVIYGFMFFLFIAETFAPHY